MNTQPQLQQQPVVVYPNTISGQPAPTTLHSHSNGSFGTVFIVLAVIIVVSGIACCIGRLCNKHKAGHQGNTKRNDPVGATVSSKQSQPNPNFRPKERRETRGREREGGLDLEFGFNKEFPTGRPTWNGAGRVHKEANMPENGHVKGVGGDSFDGGHLKPGP